MFRTLMVSVLQQQIGGIFKEKSITHMLLVKITNNGGKIRRFTYVMA